MIQIRSMHTEDIDAVSEWLITVPLMQRYQMTIERAQQLFVTALQNNDWIFLADTPESPACGFLWCVPHGAFTRSPYIRLLAVNPAISGKQTGSHLIEFTEEQARSQGYSDMFLLVSDFNTQAQKFYLRHGYKQIGTIENYVVEGVNELLFRKRLIY